MKSFFCIICTLALGNAGASEVTPVQQVIKLMQDMMAKGKQEKHDESVQFAAYKEFCENTRVSKEKAIAKAEATIESLKATIEKLAAEAKVLGEEIAAHDEDISIWKGDVKAATAVRAMEKSDYDAMHKDYSESISALERAIEVLKKQDKKTAQASLLQLADKNKFNLIPASSKHILDAFLQTDSDEFQPDRSENLDVTAPEAHGYEFQSGSIIDMLEKLLDKFIAERTDIEKAEMNLVYDFNMLIQDLTSNIEYSTKKRDEKAATKAIKLQKKADAEGDLVDTTTTMEADKKYLSDLIAECEEKANAFVSRQQLRVDELKALQKAIDIISAEEVTGAAETYLPTLLQIAQERGGSFAQLRATEVTDLESKAIHDRLSKFLQKRAETLGSRVLKQVAMIAASDPFKKVKSMIKDLITRLMEEANEEAEHKGWCDTELGTNEQTRVEKTQLVESLHAQIDQLSTSIVKLGEDLADLAKSVAELEAAMTKATKIREEEKAKNEQTIEDSKAAQKAVARALVVLKEFYDKAAEATAFVQGKQQPTPPPIFDAPYQGMGGAAGGVVGMLEVIQSDFARLESDTKNQEAAAAEEYRVFMEDSKIDMARMTTDIKHKTAKKADEEKALVVKKKDLEGTQKELDAALIYFEKLKPACIGESVSYEDRVARRKEEIVSLQDALKILNGEM